MNADELIEKYKAGERNFAGVDLEGADLQEADLQRANLNNANLTDANLSNSYLTGANLVNANLRGAHLQYSYIDWAYLNNINLEGANLQYAQIHETRLAGANFQDADLSHTELSYNNFANANLDGANLSEAFLNGNDLMGVDLTNTNLTDIKRRGANLILTTRPKNSADLEIVNKLKTEKEIGWYSDGDYSITYFLWEITGKETVTGQDIMQWGDYEKYEKLAFEEHDFVSYYSNWSEYGQVFKTTLSDIKMYFIGCEGWHGRLADIVDVYVIGKTPSGNFAGCSANVG